MQEKTKQTVSASEKKEQNQPVVQGQAQSQPQIKTQAKKPIKIGQKIFVLALIVLSFALGYLLGLGGSAQVLVDKYESEIATLQSQIERAKKFFPSSPEIRVLSGAIQEIKNNTIFLKSGASLNPFEELPEVREVIVTENTKIIRQKPKDSELLQKETADYQKAFEKAQKESSATTIFPTPPMPFTEEEIKIADLKVGDQITVEANENIKTKTSFEASRIIVQEMIGPVVVSPTPTP
jgi:hypothetical protein